MPVILQDILVTLVSLGAGLVLVRRIAALAPSRKPARACGSCSSCDGAATPRATDVRRVVDRPVSVMLLATILSAGAAGVAMVSAQAQPATQGTAIAIDAVGPQVGATVPDFTLTDQFGQPQSLSTLAGRRGLMLVFSRSADW